MCSGSEAGSYLRCIDFLYHSTLGLRVIKKRKKMDDARSTRNEEASGVLFKSRRSSTGTVNFQAASLHKVNLQAASLYKILHARVCKQLWWYYPTIIVVLPNNYAR